MKLILVASVALALTAPMAFADDNPNKPTDRELAERRCGNNGGGNDGEFLYPQKTKDGIVWVCKKNRKNEDAKREVDPN